MLWAECVSTKCFVDSVVARSSTKAQKEEENAKRNEVGDGGNRQEQLVDRADGDKKDVLEKATKS